MVNTLISVIMLTYNREKLVSRAIESVLGQTYGDFEFIIIDNGSTDRSGEIAHEFALKDSRVKVMRRPKGNIGSGRNAGLDLSIGQYIAFIDDDDYCEPDYLQFLMGLIDEHGADIAICGAAGREFDQKMVMGHEEALVTLFWRKHYNVQFPTKLIKRELFDGVRFSGVAKYDDIELFPRILASAGTVAYRGLAKYTFDRSNGDNNSAWTSNHSMLDSASLAEYLRVYRDRTEWLCRAFPDNRDIWEYFERSFMISMVEKITRYDIKECFQQRDDLVRVLRECKEAFLNCAHILGFEKEWAERYV
jgi:glycosyltransferase involved in cell wall biosynthesis